MIRLPYRRSEPSGSGYRSRGEAKIASLLEENDISFTYERSVPVIDNGKLRVWHPDFVLNSRLVLEYFGMEGDEEYDAGTRHKLRVYEENGIDVIAVYPEDLKGNWRQNVLARIDAEMRDRYRHSWCGVLAAPGSRELRLAF